MPTITSSVELKEAIRYLEFERGVQQQTLNAHYQSILSLFQPATLLKNSLRSTESSPQLVDHLIDSTLGVLVGYLTKKLVVGSSKNAFRILLGSLVKVGVVNLVASHHTTIKLVGQFLLRSLVIKRK